MSEQPRLHLLLAALLAILGADGVHPNEAGYGIMAALTAVAIEEALTLPPPPSGSSQKIR